MYSQECMVEEVDESITLMVALIIVVGIYTRIQK